MALGQGNIQGEALRDPILNEMNENSNLSVKHALGFNNQLPIGTATDMYLKI